MYTSLGKATTLARDGNKTRMTYHRTVIATKDHDAQTITLNHGGWMTLTTKKKMNIFLDLHAPGYYLYQKDFDWYIDTPAGETIEYNEQTITITL